MGTRTARAMAGLAAIAALVGGVAHAAGGTTTTPVVRVANVITQQSPGGPVTAVVPIVLDGPAATTVTLHWLTTTRPTNPAVAGRDYTAAQGTLTFVPGEVQHDVKIKIHKGVVTTSYKDFGVSLDQVTGASLGNSSGLVRIIGARSGAELDGSTVVFAPESPGRGKGYTATVTFALTATLDHDVTAQYSEQPNSDATRAYYVSKSGTMTIAAGKLTATVKLRLLRPPPDNAIHNIWIVLDAVVGVSGGVGSGAVGVQ